MVPGSASTESLSSGSPNRLGRRPGRQTAIDWAMMPVCTENVIRFDCVTESLNAGDDGRVTTLPHHTVGLFVQVEKPTFANSDRLFFIQLYRWFPSVLKAITIIRQETLVRWHRVGFRRHWRWKSRSLTGRPKNNADLQALIRRMSVDNDAMILPHDAKPSGSNFWKRQWSPAHPPLQHNS